MKTDRKRLPTFEAFSIDEAQKIDVAYAVKDLEKWNRGEIETPLDLAYSVLTNLGYQKSDQNVKNTESHLSASADDGYIPVDATVIRELIPMLESKAVNEAKYNNGDKVSLSNAATIDGSEVTGDYVVLGTGEIFVDRGKRYDVIMVQDDDGMPHEKGGMKIHAVYVENGTIETR